MGGDVANGYANKIPVGARLAREGVRTGAKSFAGKPRSYRGRGAFRGVCAPSRISPVPPGR
ncbi:hypothetical protein C9I50_09725 [Pseudomonas prosekii]|nr:hypothetical protein C9I50_09725 [Pseudomonas prosekii]